MRIRSPWVPQSSAAAKPTRSKRRNMRSRAKPQGALHYLCGLAVFGLPAVHPRRSYAIAGTKVTLFLAAMVGMTGFEPATSSSRTRRATRLRYIPKNYQVKKTLLSMCCQASARADTKIDCTLKCVISSILSLSTGVETPAVGPIVPSARGQSDRVVPSARGHPHTLKGLRTKELYFGSVRLEPGT